MTRESVIVLVSGGMDSVTALHDAKERYEVKLGLSFDYGSKHNPRELPCAAEQCLEAGVPHRVFDLRFVNHLFRSALLTSGGPVPDGHYADQNMKQTVVPFRNGIMLAIAAGVAESEDCAGVVIAAHAGDHSIYPDCREEFMKPMAEAMRRGTYAQIELLRPFIDMTKTDIVRRGVELNVNYAETWSCYKGGELHCGRCGTCTERREAFIQAGVPDPTRYADTSALPEAPGA
jgi:7-cyano-7-deazaguanine synthase